MNKRKKQDARVARVAARAAAFESPLSSRRVGAQTVFAVNSTLDQPDATIGDGQCRTGANTCTLRAAIQEANALAGADTISIPAGTYTLTIAGRDESLAATGDLDVRQDLTITGAGAGATIIDGNGIDRLFDIRSGVTATISNLTVRGGNPGAANGGAILSFGTLSLNSVTVTNNSVSTGDGGGIYSGGTLSISGGTISGNAATTGWGGGIYAFGTLSVQDSAVTSNRVTTGNGGGIRASGTATINRSTISGNVVTTGDGGGIDNSATLTLTDVTVTGNSTLAREGGGISSFDPLTLTNATITGNSAGRDGGGISSFDPLTLTNATVSGNSAGRDGGGIDSSGDSLTLTNVTVSGNSAGRNGGGVITSSDAASLTNVTLNGNSARNVGGAIDGFNIVSLRNTIVANSPSGGNCSEPVASSGNNLESGNSCGFSAPGDLRNTDPRLGPLANNGGPNETHALLTGSPAIDAGTNSGCPATDQRGATRPAGAGCDIGAYEAGAAFPCTPPRPNVGVSAVPNGDGRLLATITANTAAGAPFNRLLALHFEDGTNAFIDAGGQTGTGNFSVAFSDRPQQASFYVSRVAPGQATTVRFKVQDDCGTWPTFVGGGPNAF